MAGLYWLLFFPKKEEMVDAAVVVSGFFAGSSTAARFAAPRLRDGAGFAVGDGSFASIERR